MKITIITFTFIFVVAIGITKAGIHVYYKLKGLGEVLFYNWV